ncbi:nuclear transport factor 2 family protein [Brevundimonas sp.]|uniref:nuclear transport factor 2 family protein n=1 Tax=Brevundimonas sp. TaxID=1871086 RepID=UPI00289B492E|nr:nuclear transport factor 2 family protein [Brevundimonas sp.]
MFTALIAALALSQSATAAPTAEAQVASVLDRLNQASSTADEATYFSLFAPDARFVGTDASEHWTMAQFRAFAEPWFKQDSAWSFPATSRTITIAPIDCRCIAWFEEKLDSPSYGETRGSGVMRLTDDGWKIEQYVLSFAVPNDKADAVVALIKGAAASAH